MANYVDRDLLLKVLIHRVKGNEDHFIVLGTNNTLALVEEWVRSIDTVDAVPVVRCKGCKHWRYSGNNMFGKDYGTCVECLMDTQKDHFCSYGERKDNDI